jgi:acyl-CoA thioester hydrolase
MSRSPYETTIEVRFQDLDAFGHVNNAVFATYLEQARVGYFRDVLGLTTRDFRFVIANLEIDYRAAVTDLGPVSVRIAVSDCGRTSFTFEYQVHQGEELVAVGETVQVTVDESGTPTPIPSDWREAFEADSGLDAG